MTARRPKKHVNLVISGSGALYPAHAGAICALVELGYTFKAIAATSGGAIIGSAICASVPIERLKRIIINYNPWKVLLRKPRWPFSNGWGFFDNAPMVQEFIRMFGPISFETSPIPITIVATEVAPNFDRALFNRQNTPTMLLADACRISSTIPVLFSVVTLGEKRYIDGSFSDDVPMNLFSYDYANTLVLNIETGSIAKPTTFWQFLRFCGSLVLRDQGYRHIPDKVNMIPIEIGGFFSPLQLNLTRADRKRLFQLGYEAVMIKLK